MLNNIVTTSLENKSRYALVMCLSDPSGNPRPKRAIELLNFLGFSVDVLGLPASKKIPVRKQYALNGPLRPFQQRVARKLRYELIRMIRTLFNIDRWRDGLNDLHLGLHKLEPQILENNYSIIVVEDLSLLPLANRINKGCPIIFDAREYYPKQNDESWYWRIFEKPERIRLCKAYFPLCSQIITVSPGLAAEYEKEFGVTPSVVMSTPNYSETSPKATAGETIRLVHHGAANTNRQIEKMIETMKLLEKRFTLDLYLVGPKGRINYFKNYSKNHKRIQICQPVPFDEINHMLSGYDIGFYYLEPTGFNVTYNLPNKLFEFIQARLAVAIGPSPDMAAIVRQYNCGVVAEDFSIQAMANILNSLTPKMIDDMKHQSHLAARKLCFEQESKKLIQLINHSVAEAPGSCFYA
jgi:hypothetical protein